MDQYWEEEIERSREEDANTPSAEMLDYATDAPEEYAAIVYGDNPDPLLDTPDETREEDYQQHLIDSYGDPP